MDDTSHDDWATPSERAGYRTTPDYGETLAYVDRLARTYPKVLRSESFGTTGEGRDLRIVVASGDGEFDPGVIHASGRVVLLVQNAIHAGEMDGKDACLALLRDLARDPGRAALLDRVVLVVIPVYNIDGHERRSPYHRINQNGPETMGWRANASNLNLNRDYLKADAPETRAFLRMFRRWLPDFFVDDHVTDGADFQYDITFQLDDGPDVAPATARWIREVVTPEVTRRVNASGHLALPRQVFLKDNLDPSQGLTFFENPPRFSTGRMILENRPGLLVELHMLKDYRTRVTGNYELLVALLEVLNREASRLAELNREADRAAATLPSSSFPLVVGGTGSPVPMPFRGYRYERSLSEVSGSLAVRYVPEPWNVELPVDPGGRVVLAVDPPAGYIVPPGWEPVVDVLEAHGVELRRTIADWTGEVERYRCSGMEFPDQPFEGRFPILRSGTFEPSKGRFGTCTRVRETVTFRAGSVVAGLGQRRAKVAIHWLEPEAPDSALRWGFFAPIFEQKESGEAYVVERLAREDLRRDPALREKFEHRVATDPAFAASPDRRLDFFFDRSAWGRANRVGEYPVGRLSTLAGLPLG